MSIIFSLMPKNSVREAFLLFDRNGDGVICFNDLQAAMNLINEQLTEEEIWEMLDLADTDGDMVISYDEFYDLMVHRVDELRKRLDTTEDVNLARELRNVFEK